MPPVEEDDWETADLSTFAPPTSKPKPDLRPTAPSFQPQAIASGSKPRQNQDQSQRVFAPPGGGGRAGFVVNNVVEQRAEWDRRAAGRRGEGQGEGGEEDEWFRAGARGQTNRQLWDEANTQSPPPNVQIEAPTPLPPPQIKILRRSNQSPSLGAGNGNGNKASPSPKTYAEKEEEYRLARERIFGKTGGGAAGPGAGSDGEVGGAGGGGRHGTGMSPNPTGSRGNSPQPSPNLYPRRSPAGSPSTSQTGVLRQPKGPSAGGVGGFGQPGGGGGGGLPPGW